MITWALESSSWLGGAGGVGTAPQSATVTTIITASAPSMIPSLSTAETRDRRLLPLRLCSGAALGCTSWLIPETVDISVFVMQRKIHDGAIKHSCRSLNRPIWNNRRDNTCGNQEVEEVRWGQQLEQLGPAWTWSDKRWTTATQCFDPE